jgi:hypothetical protein
MGSVEPEKVFGPGAAEKGAGTGKIGSLSFSKRYR